MLSAIELGSNVVMNSIHTSTESEGIVRQRSHSSLAVMVLDNNESLKRLCSKNKTAALLLSLTANDWRSEEALWSFYNLLYGFTRAVNVSSLLFNFASVFVALFATAYENSNQRYTSAGIGFAIFIRTISVLPVQYFNQQRLQRPPRAPETLVMEESAKVASTYGITVLCTNILSTILLANGSVPGNAGTLLTEYFLGAYQCFNLLFLLLDIKASLALLDQLHILADNKKLTMEAFVSAKQEIHRRVKESRWASDLIIVPCLASTAAILVIIFLFLDVNTSQGLKIEAAAFLCLMLKELMFAAVAFVYVAKVNERADELTLKLSRSLWGKYEQVSLYEEYDSGDVDVEKGDSTAGTGILRTEPVHSECTVVHRRRPVQGSLAQVADTHRMSVYISSAAEPISFTLLFKRVSWQNVTISAGGFLLTALTGIVKNATGVNV